MHSRRTSRSADAELPRAWVAPPPATAEVSTADPEHSHDILTTAEGSNRLGVFVDFMRAAGLATLLLEEGPFTVFAPTDRAFEGIPLRGRDALLADGKRLREVMGGHVVAGRVTAPANGIPLELTTIDGRRLRLSLRDGTYYVGTARLVQTSIPASNGIIHAISALLIPPDESP